ncbi:hypothetical protein DFH07DRAFT_1055278, partial [Mycena maculata]
MADPITVATTLITFVTFIKDLIEVGQSIKESIEKVGENRRRIRELTNDILLSLVDLANLTQGREDEYQAPELLGALGELKANMLHVLSMCRKLIPVERMLGLRGFGSQVKVWMKRNEVEREIQRLKEHVNSCYIKFTAFSTARIEERAACIEDMSLDTGNTTLRVEQTVIINHVENQVRLRRLEGMVARILLEDQFGQDFMSRTVEIISLDSTHESLESQYLSSQTIRLIDSLQHLLKGKTWDFNASLWDPGWPFRRALLEATSSSSHVLQWILETVLEICDSPTGMQIDSLADELLNLGAHLHGLGLTSLAIAWQVSTIQILGHIAGRGWSVEVLPWLAHSLVKLSKFYQHRQQDKLALQASQQSLNILQSLSGSWPDAEIWPLLTKTLTTHSANSHSASQHEVAISCAQEAVAVCRPMVAQIVTSGSDVFSVTAQTEYSVVTSSRAFFTLGKALSSVERHMEAYESSKEGFQTILQFSGSIRHPAGKNIDSFIDRICKVAEEGAFSLVMLADDVILFRDLARIHQRKYSSQFLRLLHAYVYISGQGSTDSDPLLGDLRIFLEPDPVHPAPELGTGSNFTVHIYDFDAYGGVVEDAIRARYLGPWTSNICSLIRSLFITHFDQATDVIRAVAESLMTDSALDSDLRHLVWALNDILDEILPIIPRSKQLVLLGLREMIIGHFRGVNTSSSSSQSGSESFSSAESCWGFWIAGLFNEALEAAEEAIKCPGSRFDSENLGNLRVFRTFGLCEMVRISEAVETIQQSREVFPDPTPESARPDNFIPWLIQTRILRRTARDQEALQLLRRIMSTPSQKYQDSAFDVHFNILLTEFA